MSFAPTVLCYLADNAKMCYTYDNLSRVTNRTIKNECDCVISSENFTYDAAGNISDAPNSCFAYDTNNRLITFNGNTVTYDMDGVEEFIKDDPYALIVFDTDNNGFFTAEKLSERHRGLNLIMISGSEQYAVDAFRHHVSDFWLYPYTAERVEEAFRHLRHTPEKGSQFS